MKLVVGLGNPGDKYKNTRHNVGFWVVDQMALRMRDKEVLFFKPQKFMNRSGAEIKKYLKKHPKIELKDMFVIYDDLDIGLGEYKISFGKGPKDHRGVQNIFEQLGTKDFWQVRIGVGGIRPLKNLKRKKSKGYSPLGIIGRGQGVSGEEYVLGNWKPEEKEIMEKVIEKAIKELLDVLD